MVTIYDNLACPQGSEIWEAVRHGKATASEIKRIITTSQLKPSTQSKRYAIECACELQGIATPKHPPTFAMERGLELEPVAADEYQKIYPSYHLEHVGFVLPDDRHFTAAGVCGWGCSPDRLVNDDGLLEIKCPLEVEKVVEYSTKPDEVPTDYKLQCQFQLWVCGREWLDFFAYHPDFSFLSRVTPDEDCFAAFERYLPRFCEDVATYSEVIQHYKASFLSRGCE